MYADSVEVHCKPAGVAITFLVRTPCDSGICTLASKHFSSKGVTIDRTSGVVETCSKRPSLTVAGCTSGGMAEETELRRC